MKAILLDIEGTTTPIDFVHKTLFPFAKSRIAVYVRDHFDELSSEIDQLTDEHSSDADYSAKLSADSPESVAAYLKYLIDTDRKSTPLKSIQGKIWQRGYEAGELRAQVFDDVPQAFERWKAKGKLIAIYSSGSVLAQQLIFRYSSRGDLTPMIDRYFDTGVGGKRETESYRKIVAEIGIQPYEIAFVSDIVDELDAAESAGMKTALSIREGNAAVPENAKHPAVTTLTDLPF